MCRLSALRPGSLGCHRGVPAAVDTIARVSWLSVALLAGAVLAVVGAEWPRLAQYLGLEARRRRSRERRKAQFRVLRGERGLDDESDEFAASVERDLSQLPTIDEHDRRR
jgi:hypothetical protein